MAASEELLINALVTCAAISGSQARYDNKPVVLQALLVLSRPVAIETVDVLLGMLAHLVFMHNGVLLPRMAFGALARSPHTGSIGLIPFGLGPRAAQEECTDNQRKGQHDSNEDVAKCHAEWRMLPAGLWA